MVVLGMESLLPTAAKGKNVKSEGWEAIKSQKVSVKVSIVTRKYHSLEVLAIET